MKMQRRTFLYGTAAVTAAMALARPGLAQGDLKARLDAALSAPVERGDIPMALGAITGKDATLYEAAFGERALGSGEPINVDSVFYIASMTKAITGAAAMQLVEQGKLDLDLPVSTWLPNAADLQVLDHWDGETPVLRAPSREITLRDLMTHSTGMASAGWSAEMVRYREHVGGLPEVDYADPDSWIAEPLMFDPGTAWHYGGSINWIGRLVVEVSGQPLGEYVKQQIFDPLEMESTGWKLTPAMAERRVDNHQRQPDGSLTVIEFKPQVDPVREYGSGGLYSTTPDYQKFIRMILNKGTANGHQLLKPETVAEMSVNQMGDVRVVMLKTTDATRSVDAEFFPGLEKSWGMTFMINEEEAPTGRPAGGLAWAGLYNTFFWIDPKNEIGGVYMSQLLPFVDEKVLSAFNDFEAAYYEVAAS